MRVSLSVTVQQPVERDLITAFEENIAMVHHARDHGWDALSAGQHYLNEGNRMLQQVPMLARLQAEAGEMDLCLGVMLLNLHNPVYVAETIASLDVISRGRLFFGVGLGYREVEFAAFGVPKGQRLRRFLDVLEVVKRLWTEDEVSFTSDYCTLEKVHLTIRPVQQPHPPIWLAANNDAAVRRAARIADAWFVNGHSTLPTLRRQLGLYRAELAACGKPLPAILPAAKEIFCARDRKTAIALAAPYLGAKYANYAQWGQDQVMPSGETFQQPFESLLEERFVLGSPEECYEQLRPYWEEFEVNQLNLRTRWVGMPLSTALASMRLISTELLPELRKVGRKPAWAAQRPARSA
ncbi:MAG: LLM class flavin-dependent oxidoreductase [Candidatus Lambdaproteobacteria bacterium]|nr:LLM class flavin-dependent oxidoreductase [Candidatus Lambdaproteobacteria bacterium]